MQIREAQIFNFGKLQDRSFAFAPGINVIYGANEAGKTTLHDFLTAMLFGMEKGRGRAASGGMYARYEPWHAAAYYSGALRFSVEGRPFYLERNFYRKEKKEILRNEADGEELSVAYGDLDVLLGGISAEAFRSTYDIGQSKAAASKELAAILTEYLSDAVESGEAGVRVSKAQSALAARRKELNLNLKNIKEQKNQELRKKMMEKELLERDCRELTHSLADAECKISRLKKIKAEKTDRTKEEEAGQAASAGGKKRRWLAAAGAAAAGFLLNLGMHRVISYAFGLFLASEGLLLLLTVLFFAVFLRTGEAAADKSGESLRGRERAGEVGDENDYAREAVLSAEHMMNGLRDTLAEKEARRCNLSQQIEAMQAPGVQERELLRDIQALELASAEITRLARERYEDSVDELNGAVSGWVAGITGGAYDSVTIDDGGGLKILTEGREVPPEALSRGTLEQIYLAFRLAVGDIVTREEAMPVFLDEAFCMYDDGRLRQALMALAGEAEQKQIFIFTCQRREMEALDELGLPYHKVYLT